MIHAKIPIPEGLAETIDLIVKESRGAYRSRYEFIRDAVRRLVAVWQPAPGGPIVLPWTPEPDNTSARRVAIRVRAPELHWRIQGEDPEWICGRLAAEIRAFAENHPERRNGPRVYVELEVIA